MSLETEIQNRRKAIREFTWKDVAPPYDDHLYFEGAEGHPFQPRAKELEWVNAWWLAEASTLAYSEESFARAQFARAGFTETRFFDKGSTQCFVARRDTHAIVVFRGTEARVERSGLGGVKQDWLTNFDFKLAGWKGTGMVHEGFRDALESIRGELESHLESLGDRAVWFTGHSLGAALATLAAQSLGVAEGLYTFGSPRVGDEDFARDFTPRTFRFVNNEDLVTRVPLGLFVDVGTLRYIDHLGGIRTERPSSMLEVAQSAVRRSSRFLRRLLKGPDHLVPLGLEDHVPLLYATHLWNRLIAN